MMKRSLILTILSLVSLAPLWGQAERVSFAHLEATATVGNAGVGFELSTPLVRNLSLRAGMSFTPHISSHTTLDVYLHDQPIVPTYDETGVRTDRMGKLMEMVKSFTGYEMDEQVDLYMQPTMWNAKLLLDWTPFAAKNFHFTAGLYLGPQQVAFASNEQHEMHTLTGMRIYNGMYDRIMAGKPILSVGNMAINFPEEYEDYVRDYGAMTIPAGTSSDGKPYSFSPGSDGRAKAEVLAQSLRPFVGVGYTHWFDAARRTSVTLDLGLLYWGKPEIVAADDTDLASEVHDIPGKLGEWTDRYAGKSFMPVLELRISHRLF